MFMQTAHAIDRLGNAIDRWQTNYGCQHFGWSIRPFLDHPKWVAHRKTKPIQYFLVIDCLDRVHSGLQWLATRVRKPAYRWQAEHRYHLIDTKLSPGYYDIDTLMLHGMMALLVRYVEVEMGGEAKIEQFNANLRKFNPDDVPITNSRQADNQEEALTIYRWWKYQRDKDHQTYEAKLTGCYRDYDIFADMTYDDNGTWGEIKPPTSEQLEGRVFGDKLDETDAEMLHRLITIRGTLWT